MANLQRNFIAGKMNKILDERLVPNGEYIDAMNIRMGSTELSEVGVIENTKGNLSLTSLKYIDGTPLSADAVCIGAITDGAHETIYWFVHDPNFPLGSNKLDLIVSFNVYTSILTYHVVSVDDGTGNNTTLNFNPKYLITGVDIIDNLLFFTDDYNAPRFVDTARSYPNPVGDVDQFTEESLLVIKKPPVEAPSVQPITTGGQENFMETRFICFAYRYRYANGEYSATSQFSAPSFVPNPFNFSINSFLNEGMVNLSNTAVITYNTGDALVVGIDLLFKEADSSVIKVIEKLDKAELGLADNTDYTYTFTNSKIFTVLPEAEILRLYDNVPRFAKAQTIMGNRLMYGNYVEGYDMIDLNGNAVKLEYQTSLITELIGSSALVDSTASGNYTINGPQTIPDCIVQFDLDGMNLVQGAALSVEIGFAHNDFSGDPPEPTETTSEIRVTFSFFLPTNYASVYEMATSVAFQEAVGTALNIKPVYDPTPGNPTSCDGFTFTDQVNCAIPNNLDTLTKYASGISGGLQPIGIVTSPASTVIGLQLPAMRYVDSVSAPTQNVYEYYSVTFAEANFQEIANPRSLHSNRGYEIGIVYMDDFNRSTTALVSPNNTEHVPCGYCGNKNSIRVTIPVTQIAPSWATRFKFVIKPDSEGYDTIYSNIFFEDPETNNAYFLLEGENARKVEQGDRLIVKADTNGAAKSCIYATVLEKESKQANFLSIPSELDPSVDIPIPAGVYMKINPNNFAVVNNELSTIHPGQVQTDENTPGDYVLSMYDMNRFDTVTNEWVDYSVPAGSRIDLFIKFQRLGTGDGNNSCNKIINTIDKVLIASADYDNMKDWFDGDNVENVLKDGVQDIGAGEADWDNTYIPTLASSIYDIPTPDIFNPSYYYRFYRYPTVPGDPNSNRLVLLLRGMNRCTGLFSAEKRRATIITDMTVFRADTTLIFETEPSDAAPDIWYENDQSFVVYTPTGEHEGNVQSQNFGLGLPAIIDTEFFNCFAFGNGAESYKIRDSIIGKTFNLGNRVTSTAAQDYKEADRFADITYSGIYNNETNVNKLNEFNLGLLNFKALERSFGPIYVLDGRETDVLALQEDKVSYVLAGKNLLSDAAAGGAITSVPEVLGTQIARVEKYGISFNPESYVQWGYDRFFTDAKRGAVIRLRGNSYSSDQLDVVSDASMDTWFRDLFINSFNTQKLGAYDPYMGEYVLSSNDIELPVPVECVECGLSQTLLFTEGVGGLFQYCVNVGQLVGFVEISYVVTGTPDPFEVSAIYNGVLVTSGPVTTSGSIMVDKNLVSDGQVDVSVQATGALNVVMNVGCPAAPHLTIIEVVLTNNNEAGDTVHAEYRYVNGAFTSPLQSNFVSFISGSSNPLVSRYNSITGLTGSGGFPPPASTMTIRSNKIGFDTFSFDPASDKFRYLESDTLYGNNSADLFALLAASSTATPISGSGNTFYSSFPVAGGTDYLYLIWDFRDAYPVELCYSTLSTIDACCNCIDCGTNCVTYNVSVTGGVDSNLTYFECGTGDTIEVTVLAGTTQQICTSGAAPVLISGGEPSIWVEKCGCACADPCEYFKIVASPGLPVTPLIEYVDCATGKTLTYEVPEGTSYLCVETGTTPSLIVGNATISYEACGCPT